LFKIDSYALKQSLRLSLCHIPSPKDESSGSSIDIKHFHDFETIRHRSDLLLALFENLIEEQQSDLLLLYRLFDYVRKISILKNFKRFARHGELSLENVREVSFIQLRSSCFLTLHQYSEFQIIASFDRTMNSTQSNFEKRVKTEGNTNTFLQSIRPS
jgi:hypothetical protein